MGWLLFASSSSCTQGWSLCAAWIILSLNERLHYSMKNILNNSSYFSSALTQIFSCPYKRPISFSWYEYYIRNQWNKIIKRVKHQSNKILLFLQFWFTWKPAMNGWNRTKIRNSALENILGTLRVSVWILIFEWNFESWWTFYC